MFLWTVTSCVGPAQTPPLQPPAEQKFNHTSIVPAQGGSTSLNRPPVVRRTVAPGNGEGPTLVVIRNSYLTTQHVFVDSQSIVVLPPQAERSFSVKPGAHTITVSDSANGRQNPQYMAEVFDAGFEYRYEIVAR